MLTVQPITIREAISPSAFDPSASSNYTIGRDVSAYGITDGRGNWYRIAYMNQDMARAMARTIEAKRTPFLIVHTLDRVYLVQS